MFGPLLIVLLQIQLHLVTALFTVEVLQSRYSAEWGGNVTMGCRFPVRDPFNLTNVSILWQRQSLQGHEVKEVYKLSKGQEDLRQQHMDYQGRVTVVLEELKMGRSMLHITNVKITDAGRYVCLVHDEGVDLKYINLDVEAPYRTINFHERKEKEELILTCQSEGYPLAEVSWHSEKSTNLSIFVDTTYQVTDYGLFNITSTLRIKSYIRGNYSCVFWNRKLNEKTSAHGPTALPFDSTDVPSAENRISFILPICVLVLLLLMILLFMFMKRKIFTNWCPPKCKRRKRSKSSKKEDLDIQTRNFLNAATITD